MRSLLYGICGCVVAVAAVAALLLTAGCATLQLDDNATAQDRRAAHCADAQMGYALSCSILEGSGLSLAAGAYWIAYKAGASLALQTFCPGEN